MADLVVRPSIVLGPNDILTVDKFNLMATPVVELQISDRVDDQSFFRNGNFYSSFWANAAGVSCPVGVNTFNANYWYVRPIGAAVTTKRDTSVPDTNSLFSLEIDGANNVAEVYFGQNINADLSATLRRICTFSGYIFNNSGLTLSPKLLVFSCDSFNNFNTVTQILQVDLQTASNGSWTFMSATFDLTGLANVANGITVELMIPTGGLSATSKRVNFSRIKFQIGEIATEFVDDVALFVQSPSVDSTMLQDGCIARPSLFLPNVVPAGAYVAGSIHSGDIGVGQVKAANLDPGINTTTAANFTVPAVNANVAITMTSAAGILAGLLLTIQGAGAYSAVSVAGNVVTAQNTGASGNASAGTIINSGASVTTSGNAVVGALGFTPVNKAGDTAVGLINHSVDTVVGPSSGAQAAVVAQVSAANKANDGYFPALGFVRDPVAGPTRSVGLTVDNRLKTVDFTGKVGYIGDSITQLDNSFYQDKSITLNKLADSLVNLIIPPGIMANFAGPNPPTGWLVCDGTAVSRTTYSALFAAIGTYWGAGDNIDTFNLPDLRGRTPIGYVNSPVGGITSRTFATRGGEENHVLSIGELASHNHAQGAHTHSQNAHSHTDSGHTHTCNLATSTFTIGGGNQTVSPGGTIGYNPGTSLGYANLNSVVPTINATVPPDLGYNGGNGGHNTMMPFAVVYIIIKT
jgi:microcystin-dependent protein